MEPKHNSEFSVLTISKPALAAAALFIFICTYAAIGATGNTDSVAKKAMATPAAFEAATDPAAAISVEAKAAYLYDLTSGRVLYAKNEDAILPLASLTKIMMAITALQGMDAGEGITIPAASIALEGDNGLLAGEKWNLGSLLQFTLIESSNDGANAIATAYDAKNAKGDFVKMMNTNAANLGLTSMHFLNETGLDVDDSTNGGYGSAREFAKLFDYAVRTYPETLSATALQSTSFSTESGIVHTAENTDSALSSIPHPIASKTGFTFLAGGNLALEFFAGKDKIVAVILGSSQEGRFSDAKKLAELAQKLRVQ